jgi:hypothetical protein
MTHATLKLTDCPEGLNMEVFYEGGMNPLSPAHTHIEALIGKLAELAEPVGEAIHLSADEVAAMQSNALPPQFKSVSEYESKLAAGELASFTEVAIDRAASDARDSLKNGGTIIDAMAAFGESIDRDLPDTTKAENRAQFDKLMADTQNYGPVEVAGIPQLSAGRRADLGLGPREAVHNPMPTTDELKIGIAKLLGGRFHPNDLDAAVRMLLDGSAAAPPQEVWVITSETSVTYGHGDSGYATTLAIGRSGFLPAFASEKAALAFSRRVPGLKAIRLDVAGA